MSNSGILSTFSLKISKLLLMNYYFYRLPFFEIRIRQMRTRIQQMRRTWWPHQLPPIRQIRRILQIRQIWQILIIYLFISNLFKVDNTSSTYIYCWHALRRPEFWMVWGYHGILCFHFHFCFVYKQRSERIPEWEQFPPLLLKLPWKLSLVV